MTLMTYYLCFLGCFFCQVMLSSTKAINDRTEDATNSGDLSSRRDLKIGVDNHHDVIIADELRRHQRKISAGQHFLFWKTITHLVIPEVQYTQKATESSLIFFCGSIGKSLRNEECFKDAKHLLEEWPVEDFPRAPSDQLMRIKDQHKFEKALMKDMVLVLQRQKANLTQLMNMEKVDYCRGQDECAIDCSSPSSASLRQHRLYCDISKLILPHFTKVLRFLEKEAKRYFNIRLKSVKEKIRLPEREIYTHNKDSYKLAVLYNIMEQNHETEAALEYLVDISKFNYG